MAQPSEKVSQRTNFNCEQSRQRLPSTCYVKALSPKGIENPEEKDLQPYTSKEPPGGEAANPDGDPVLALRTQTHTSKNYAPQSSARLDREKLMIQHLICIVWTRDDVLNVG